MLPGLNAGLRSSGDTVADLYTCKIANVELLL